MGCSASKPPDAAKVVNRHKSGTAEGRVQSRTPSHVPGQTTAQHAAPQRTSGDGPSKLQQKEPQATSAAAVPSSGVSKASMDVDMALVDRMLEISSKSEIIRSGPVNIPDVSTIPSRASPERISPNRQSSLRAPETPPHRNSGLLKQDSACVDPADPWANLQSAYAIRDTGSPDKQDGRASNLKSGSLRTSGRNALGSGEMVVLDEDGETRMSTQPLYSQKPAPRGGVLAAKPVQGGWSQGAMAKAGELMVGREDDTLRLTPREQAPPGAVSSPDLPLPGGLGDRIKAMPLQSDLGMEDIEDADVLIEQNQQSALKPDLAAKLAAFEALAGDDD